MKKTFNSILICCIMALVLTFSLASCNKSCEHVYDDCADIECNLCGETRDSMHTWKDADCVTPKTCTVCQKTDGEALGHTAEADDGNCTTEIKCATCGTVLTSGKTQHVAHADDGDCTTPVTCTECSTVITAAKSHDFSGAWEKDASGHWHVCKNDGCSVTDTKADHISDGSATEEKAEKCTVCEYVITPELDHTHNHNIPKYDTENHWIECACGDKSAVTAHTANDDDGDCTTAVTCSGCAHIMTAAKAHTPNEDDGDCTTDITCKDCGKVTTAGYKEHTPNADDGDCTTAIICQSCDIVTTEARSEHTGGSATCTHGKLCEVCGYEYSAKVSDNHESDVYAYTDNGDGTHTKAHECGVAVSEPENHTIVNHICTDCGAMEIVVSFDAGDYEWKTGDTLYFCRVSHDNEWEEYCFTATVAEDGTVTWTPDKPLYWDGMGEHSLIVSYPANMGLGWDDFAIPSDQSTPELLRGADHMNARWAGTPTTNVINFELKHRMAKITVKYVLASQFDGMEDVTAKIYSNAKYCIFSDADGLPIITSVGQYDAWITPYYAGKDITVYVTPGEYNMYDSLKVYADGVLQSIDIRSDYWEVENMTLEEGGEYTFEVKVGKDKLHVLTEDITITDYPGGWNSDSEENLNGEIAIGTSDDGKTGWAVGDQVFVTLTSDYFGAQTYVYTFDGNGWTFEDDCFYYLEDEVPTVTAIYAPCYEYDWWDKPLVLTNGMMLGMTEYLEAYCEMDNCYSINVDFESTIRDYSRLRIVGQANTTYTVTVTDFTSAGTTETGTHTYTLTTDKDGNAYLYGTFAEDATVTVKKGEITLTEYTFTAEKNPNGTEHNKSYVLGARAVIDGTLGGKAEATEADVNALVEQLKAYVDNGITTIIVTGTDHAMYDSVMGTIPAYAEALYLLADGNDQSPYCGTIDLILPDATEIVDHAFDNALALKSITLPKVTTVGDGAFYGCTYLRTMTFGSVVTTIIQNEGVVFYYVGEEVGGCDLVLNCGQMNSTYIPDLTANTWYDDNNKYFKSITLTHTGECDECKANH